MVERVVVTGLGIISCLGNDSTSVSQALHEGRSGISLRQDHIDAGMRSHIAGTPDIDLSEHCLLYTSPSPRDGLLSRMPSSA